MASRLSRVHTTRIAAAIHDSHLVFTLKRLPRGARPIMSHQPIDAPLTTAATFLVFSATEAPDSIQTIRKALSSLSDIAKNIAIRHSNAHLSCVTGIGSSIWDSLTMLARPAELHPFPEVQGKKHHAVSTPGDLLFHIRAERRDMCFEFERQLMSLLGEAVRLEDQTTGFRYFDARDLLGFVDGTANPVGSEALEAVRVSDVTDTSALSGSYVVVQKYIHDIKAWQSISTEKQEAIIGRTKLDNIELADADQGQQQSHKTLATIEDENGEENSILRDNMPFGRQAPGSLARIS